MSAETLVLIATRDPGRRENWFEAARRAGGAHEAVFTLEALMHRLAARPDAAAMLDVEQMGLHSRGDIEDLRVSFQNARLLAFCSHCSHEDARFLVRIGVDGYLALDADVGKVTRALSHVLEGRMWLPRRLMEDILREYLRGHLLQLQFDVKDELAKLTPRQQEVAMAISEGLSNRAVAERFNISVRTAKAHVSAILDRTGTRTRTELVSRIGRVYSHQKFTGTR